MFRFTPTPVSSASIFWWCGKGGFADRKCTLDDTLERWFDERFPPLSIYHGGRDFLVLAEPLIERMQNKEKDVKVIKVTKLDKSEVSGTQSMTQERGADESTATSTGRPRRSSGRTGPSSVSAASVHQDERLMIDDIERTRPKYPEELEETTQDDEGNDR
jgi:hypothetical protein